MRLFVAVRPPPAALADLDSFLEVRRDAADFRWTPAYAWHLTLAFCPDLAERHLDDLNERLTRAAAKRSTTTVRLSGGGAFPQVSRARVLWTGAVIGDRIEMDRLATGAKAAITKAGGEVDRSHSGRRFHPHLTVARSRQSFEATSWVRLLDTYDGPNWTIEEIELVVSHLGEGPRREPRHEVIASFPLSPSP